MLSISDKSEAMVLAFRHIVMNSAESLSFSSEERGVGPNGQSSKSPNAVSLSLFEKNVTEVEINIAFNQPFWPRLKAPLQCI